MNVLLHSNGIERRLPVIILGILGALGVLLAMRSSELRAETLAKAQDRGDFVAYSRILDDYIESRLKKRGFQPDDRVLFHALAVEELIRTTGVEAMTRVAETPEGRDFLKIFLVDRDWVPLYVSNGPFPTNIPDGLLTLARIVREDPDAKTEPYRSLATAVALTFFSGRLYDKGEFENLREEDGTRVGAVDRYRFYKESHQAGKLHPMFDGLAPWALRFVVCARQGNGSLTWLQDNVDVPLDEIDGVCWVPRYRGVSSFGDTIQGPLFYAASCRALSCWAEDVAKNGGVCGALSTFGTTYAQARGIPATTKGQPAHCAYAYRAAPGDWVASFGGPDGSSHCDFWRDQFAYTWMADDLFSDVEKTTEADRLYWLARHRHEKGGLRSSFPCFNQALDKQPIHYPARRALIDACLADTTGFMNEKRWFALASELISNMQKHPMPMHELLALFDEKNVWPSLPPARRMKLFLDEHQAIASNIRPGWTPWNVSRDVLERQARSLSEDELVLFRDALACYIQAGHQHLIGELIGWGGKRYSSSPERENAFISSLIAAFSKGRNVDEAIRRKIFSQAILAAETSKSIGAFQQLNNAVRDLSKAEQAYDYKRPTRGKLIGDKGLIYFGKLDHWDPPLLHRALLTEGGGAFHGPGTFDGKPNFAVVVLPESRKLAEIVLVNRPRHEVRNQSLSVYVSNDEQNWTEIGRCDDFGPEFRLDLRTRNVEARFVKIEKGTPENESFHLRNICIYAD